MEWKMEENRDTNNIIEFVRNKIADEETVYDLAELFKVFGDTTRAKILSCLEVRDLYVGEIAEVLNMSISAVSHQLRVLRNAKLVRGVKEGKEVKYSLDDNHVMMIIECGMSHIKEDK
ncbi:MAG: winged helix-turn-helix transcriptional regulator [Clostridia bacterium]|nr:winged helix-turn-helix transcriptional regulator [Clostridia bacterium]